MLFKINGMGFDPKGNFQPERNDFFLSKLLRYGDEDVRGGRVFKVPKPTLIEEDDRSSMDRLYDFLKGQEKIND